MSLPVYDVFISYRWVDPDQHWVREHLEPCLEQAGIRSVLDVEDFVPGRDLILEMTRAARESRYVLCVLSPAYFDGNRMVGFEALLARRRDPTGQGSGVIPLILRTCELPEWLNGLIPIDWTVDRNRPREWKKLLQVLGARSAPTPPPLVSAMAIERSASAREDSTFELSTAVYQAPRAPNVFVGRDEELARAQGLLSKPNALVIIRAGTGGEGKTAMASVLASRMHLRFPDGVLWARMDQEKPEAIIESFLAAVAPEVSSNLSPDSSVHSRARLFRTVMARKRCLIVFDNAVREDPLDLLLPGAGNTAVVVTTRQALAISSPSAEVRLPPLAAGDFRRLIAESIERELDATETHAMDALHAVLGGLPLAGKIAAGMIREFGWPIEECVKRLHASRRLEWLANDGSEAVRASFSLSFQLLGNPIAIECFAAIGVLGRLPITPAILCACTHAPLDQVESCLVQLVMRGMVDRKNVQGMSEYAVHPLMARYAYELATVKDPKEFHAGLAAFCREQLSQWDTNQQHFIYGSTGSRQDLLWGVAATEHYLGCDKPEDAQQTLVAIADLLTLLGQERELIRLIEAVKPRVQSLAPWLQIYLYSFLAFGRGVGPETERASAGLRELTLHADPKVASAAWITCGRLALRRLDFVSAEHAFSTSSELKLQLDPPDRKGIAVIRNEMARLAAKAHGDYRLAAELHGEAYALQRELGDIKGMAYSLWRRARIEIWHFGQLTQAAETLDEAEMHAVAASNIAIHVEIKLQKAELQARRQSYRAALETLQQCRELAECCDRQLLQARVQHNLGLLYARVEQFGNACAALTHSRDLYLQVGDNRNARKLESAHARTETRLQELRAEAESIERRLAANEILASAERRVLRRRLARLRAMTGLGPTRITLGL